MGHEVLLVLRRLGRVTPSAIRWRHDNMDSLATVLEGVLVLLGGEIVAFRAADNDVRQMLRNFRGGDSSFKGFVFHRLGGGNPSMMTSSPIGDNPRADRVVAD